MKKILFLLLLSILVVPADGIERTQAQMLTIAKQKLASVSMQEKTRGRDLQEITCILNKPTLCVYSNSTGYVIVSRDDRFPAVLAYGSSRFDVNNLPDGTKWWLDAVQEAMRNSNMFPALNVAKVKALAPMLTTKWGQGRPYNNYAPIFKKDKTKAPAGCVAIAMAQILNYNRYPASAEFEGSYSISDDEGQNSESVMSEYKWPYKDAYEYYFPEGASEYVNASYTPNQGNQVASLCRDCGYSLGMMYNPSGSGAYTYNAPDALIEKFQYPANSVRYYISYFYSKQEWRDIIYNELQKGYPFMYSGSSEKSGGHAFVGDGCDADGLVHINWGWYGASDGYYSISALSPENDDFSEVQQLVTGIRPQPVDGDVYGSMVVTDKPFEMTYDNETKTFSIKAYSVFNYCGKTIIGKVAIVFENLTDPEGTDYYFYMSDNPEDVGEEQLEEDDYTLPFGYGWDEHENSFEYEFKEGQYKVYLASKDQREAEWQIGRTYGGAFYYDMTVDASGKVTIAEAPVSVGIESVKVNASDFGKPRYGTRIHDLRGRNLGTDTNALRRGVYIIDGKKVVK